MEIPAHSSQTHRVGGIESIEKTEKHYFIHYATGEVAILNILNDHVLRFYMSPTGEFLEYPTPNNDEDAAKITVKDTSDYGYATFDQSRIDELETSYVIHINDIQILFDKTNGTLKIHVESTNKDVFIESSPLSYTDNRSIQTLLQRSDEYFFGGGMQNGRYSHKGQTIRIANTNKWDDGGVSSPCPFYWSSYGYGVLRNTWQPGDYDFGSKSNEHVTTSHDIKYFDAFIFINQKPSGILCDYYELTGQPGLMPEYAYYEAHLNAFNRDYWVEVDSDTPGAIQFEDGLYYKSYKPNDIGDKEGILESLNGENDNYQFSARGMIDRYKKHDMPLGWFIPNDGYGCGYGQTDSLDGDIQNLKEFTEYSLQNGVQVGLWTESNLHPLDPMDPKKGERDLSKEVGVANVVALKCDVAWIGSGYSFGLNAVEKAADTFKENTTLGARPLIITVDGWAGTQRHCGIWSGDQTGGEWEYIRFHIPSYIGTGLSGQPIVGSDMDGIYGGGDRDVNIRDYQWKTFTPLQLNMDGWGRIPKTPFSIDSNATSINRAYLKLKSMLMPYNYTIGHEAISGLPMVRAMFLEFPDSEYAYTSNCQYQFMWGPNLLVAPVYNMEELNEYSVRNDIYLPDQNQVWIDFFTGQKYQGGKILNNLPVPLWQIPVFVKDGSIIPMTNSNNNPTEIQRDNRIFTFYPNGKTSFDVYEDDGITSQYLKDQYAITNITMVGPVSNESGDLSITINETKGTYKDMEIHRSTVLQIMAVSDVENIEMTINGEFLALNKVDSDDAFAEEDNIFYFKTDFTINPYFYEITECDSDNIEQKFLLIKINKLDVTSSIINITVKNFTNNSYIFGSENKLNDGLRAPSNLRVNKNKTAFNCIVVQWDTECDADYYEIERDGYCYTNIQEKFYLFENFEYDTEHSFRIRSINQNGISEWSDMLYARTSVDPLKFVVNDVNVTCNTPCQPGQEVSNFALRNRFSSWHTIWDNVFGDGNSEKPEFLELSFDLGNVYEIDRIEYTPRKDAGNGTILIVQYTYSDDGEKWSEMSEPIQFNDDNSIKIVSLNGKRLRYFKLKVLDSVGGYGSGETFLFFKTS